jgi:D,D-heptose 1,7-bisphosphate phosphatase
MNLNSILGLLKWKKLRKNRSGRMIIEVLSIEPHSKKTILFDRDGTINIDNGYVSAPTTPQLTDNFFALINKISFQPFNIGIISNQSGIGRNKFTFNEMFDFNRNLRHLLANHDVGIDLIVCCPHVAEDDCGCRKPKPRMLLVAAKLLNSRLEDIIFIGNSPVDSYAAELANVLYVDINDPNLIGIIRNWECN